MIYYFSGSGNSRAVAERLGQSLAMPVYSIFAPQTHNTLTPTKGCIGFVLPVYSWGIPPQFTKWLKNAQMHGNVKPDYIWAVLTYGDEAALSASMLQKALRVIGLQADVIFGLQMPNTYVLLPGFDVDAEEVALKKISDAKLTLANIETAISSKCSNAQAAPVHVGPLANLKSHFIYKLFCAAGINSRFWKVDKERCIGCGLCKKSCPVSNIALHKKVRDNNKVANCHAETDTLNVKLIPHWGKNCTSCLGCYHSCPVHAIQYRGAGTRHKGQWRYWFTHKATKQTTP